MTTWGARAIAIGPAGAELPATIVRPGGSSRVPGVVLIHGSGPHDRDETIGPNKPLRDLAEGLAARGVATLRFDKRSAVYPAALAAKRDLTVRDEVLDDARAAVDALGAQGDVGPVFVAGHSLGGTLAPRIAADDARVAGIVILAGAVAPLGELAIEQADAIARAKGALGEPERAALDALRAEARRTLDPALSPSTPGRMLGAPASYWLDLRGYDPVATARALDRPILVAQGGRDYQVTTREYERWRRGLADRPRVVLRLYPALDHLFRAGEGASTPADYARPGRVDDALIDDVAAFVRQPPA